IMNPTYPSPDSLSAGFCIFVSSDTPCNTPARQVPKPPGIPPELTRIIITGTHRVDKDGYSIVGGGAWFSMNNPRNKSIKVPKNLAAPGTGEISAILSAISTLPANTPLQLATNSSSLRKSLTSNLSKQEDIDWHDHPNRILMKKLVTQLRQ
ncbi:hypothetical protein CY34DRAFT_30222, partial [Suillus luteus UH-Slu-Lm8-n1]